MMQWSNLTKCSLFLNIVSPAVHILLPLMLQHLNSCGIEALILILGKSLQLQIWPHHWFDTASQPGDFSCWGTENSQMVPNQENMEGYQLVQSHSHTQQPLQPQTYVQEHCPGETGFSSSVFQAVWKCLLEVRTAFQSPELLIQCGVIWKETIHLVSGKVEFNACQVSLLRHNSFLVSLWTFQPTLVLYTYMLTKWGWAHHRTEDKWWMAIQILSTHDICYQMQCHFNNITNISNIFSIIICSPCEAEHTSCTEVHVCFCAACERA